MTIKDCIVIVLVIGSLCGALGYCLGRLRELDRKREAEAGLAEKKRS
jgi:hypothetical protein